MHLIIYTDGGARGNPGPAGIGVVIYSLKHKKDDWELVEKWGRYIGKATNNQAEYRALLAGLERAGALKAQEVDSMMDSELVVKQMNREYKVRDKDLASLFVQVWNITIHFKHIRFHHVPREKNKEADKLVNEAIDKALR